MPDEEPKFAFGGIVERWEKKWEKARIEKLIKTPAETMGGIFLDDFCVVCGVELKPIGLLD